MRKNRLIALIGTLTMAAAGLAAVSAGVSSKKAERVSADGTKTVFCKMTQGWWTVDNASVGVHYWGGSSSTNWPGTKMNAVTGETGVWSLDIPADSTGVIFTRLNSSGSIDWNAKTKDIDGDKLSNFNFYTITNTLATWGDPGCDTTAKNRCLVSGAKAGYNIQNFTKNTVTPLTLNSNSGEWEGSFTLEENDEFKVINLDSDLCYYTDSGYIGIGQLDLADGSAYKAGQLGGSDNIVCNVPGTYSIWFKPTWDNNKIWIPAITVNRTVSFNVNVAGYGTVSQASITVADGSSISVNGSTLTIDGKTVTATPAADTTQYDYEFTGWSKSSGTITADTIITANFTRTTNNYPITFVDYDDTQIKQESYAYGQTPTCASPTREADAQYTYTFAGWYPAISTVTGAQTYKATYTPTLRKYTLSYNLDGGSLDSGVAAGEHNYGTSITLPTAHRDGFDFGAWYTDSQLSVPASFPFDLHSNVTLYASWVSSARTISFSVSPAGFGSISNYSTSFKVNDGTSINVSGDTITIGTTAYKATPTTGDPAYVYSFDHFNGASTGTVTSDLAIEAIFERTGATYTFNYVTNGGTRVGGTNPGNYSYNQVIELPTNCTQTGCDFKGWYKDTSFTQKVENNFNLIENTTLYAKFEGSKYDVSVAVDSACTGWGTISASGVDDVPYNSTISTNGNKITINGTEITATPATDTVQYDYEFSGWTGYSSPVVSVQDIKAVFTRTVRQYTISWDVGDGTITSESDEYTHGLVDYGTTIVAPEVERDGYELASWSPAISAGATVTGTQEYVANYQVPSGQYIIGQFNGWAANATGAVMHTITGESEHAREVNHLSVSSTELEVQMIWVDSNHQVKWKSAGGNYGANYVTWYDSPSGRCMGGESAGEHGKQGTVSAANVLLPAAGTYTIKTYNGCPTTGGQDGDNFRYYAIILEEYKLDFDMGGHGTNPGTEYTLYNEAFAEPTAPTKDGNYTFAGWYTDTTYATEFNFETVYNENKVAYAKWSYESVPVTISFNTNGGTTISPINGNSGESYTKPEDPTKLNNTFAGWNPTLPNVLPDTNTTYNATWTVNNGTYIAKNPTGLSMDGQHVMTANPDKDSEFLIQMSVTSGDKFKVYYANNGSVYWDDASNPTFTYNNPVFKDKISIDTDKNLVINLDGDFTIYFNTSTKNYHVADLTLPENGRYFVINGVKTKAGLVPTQRIEDGWTGVEYKARLELEKGDLLSAFYQDATQATEYDLILQEGSVKEWATDPITSSLICPEDGMYSLYLISKDSGANYNYVAIYQEGEEAAITFAETFLNAMNDVCILDDKGHVSTDPSALASAWSQLYTGDENPYSKLSNDAKALLRDMIGDPESSNKIKQFAASYNYIYGKYHETAELYDFAGRNPVVNSGSRLFSVNDVSSSTWIIATVAIVGIAAVGVFFIYRKRKEN